jgi:hypothetical protein
MRRVTAFACATLLVSSSVASVLQITPFSTAEQARLPPPWQVVTLPKIPRHTTYGVVDIDGHRVVEARADNSYAGVLHPVHGDINATPILHFAWRADRFPAGSDLSTKEGDDLAAKLCLLFDLPLERLSFRDRVRIDLGRRLFDPQLPSATLCYVWDRTLPPGTWLPNAYTDRVRMLVLRSAQAGEACRWYDERRDLRADFKQAFGREAGERLPQLSAVAIGADADNTSSTALAFFGDIRLAPP